MKSKFIRMNMETYRRLRRNFKAEYKESAASYFERLSLWLEADYSVSWSKENNYKPTLEKLKKDLKNE